MSKFYQHLVFWPSTRLQDCSISMAREASCAQLMRMSEDGPLQPTPLWDREDLNPGGLVREFLRECRIVRKGLDGSLFKVAISSMPCSDDLQSFCGTVERMLRAWPD